MWSGVPRNEVPAEILEQAPPPPRKRTLARKKYDYERHLARWGNHAEAAARTGVDERTARRWRQEPVFAGRCELSLQFYRQAIEMEAHARAETPEYKVVWYRGRQIGHLRRFNDRLMMRLVARLPRPREED